MIRDQGASTARGSIPQSAEVRLQRLAAIVESADDAMMACNLEGHIETWNPAASTLFGFGPDEILGRALIDLFHPTERARVGKLVLEASRGFRSELTRTMGLAKDGSDLFLSIRLSVMRDGAHTVRGISVVARDISARWRAEDELQRSRCDLEAREATLREALTALRASHEELKSTQLQLIQSAKLESVGRLAAGVAHEVKNPLAVILASAELLLARGRLSLEQVKTMQDMKDAVQRASSVIGGLLKYSSASELNATPADLNVVLEQALLLVQHALARTRIQVVRNLAPNLPKLLLDVTKIQQVFINLFINAIDAMPDGGTLTIRTRRIQLTAAHEGVGMRRADPLRVGQSVALVEIEDTGPGIPSDQLGKLFDPFFTTKPTGKGTGLGLAVSKTIVGMHGGTIWIRNLDPVGVIVTVVLRSTTHEKGAS